MKRVVHVCTDPDFWRFDHLVLRHLVRRGFDVHAVSQHATSAAALETVADITRHDCHITRAIAPRQDVRALAQLTRLLRQLRPALLHAHTPKGGLVGMLAASAARVPNKIYHCHGLRYETATGARRSLLKQAERTSCSLADRVIFVSPSVRKQARQDSLVNETKALILGNGSAQGIELDDYEPSNFTFEAADFRRRLGIAPDARCILYLGRLARDKGLADLEQAWASLREQAPDVHLIVGGKNDLTDPIELRALRSDPRAHFTGELNDPRPAILASTVLVLPSYREGLPQCILEASAMGKAVVATRVTGVIDAVRQDRTGLLVPAHSPPHLSEALLHLLAHPDLTRSLGARGRSFVAEHFAVEPMLSAVDAVYDELLAR